MKEAVELSGLGPRVDDKIKTYSRGMRRKLVVAALLREIALTASLQ